MDDADIVCNRQEFERICNNASLFFKEITNVSSLHPYLLYYSLIGFGIPDFKKIDPWEKVIN